ncbi:P1 family peptidase [Vagococcus sp. PNs007]|uniref:P1 family peptidase n=1 Tax=Vagococcus proximus TaxID=2991417 RepID=A0ABT5X2Z6_9ENTE|nr:P1 family peptidase [Vagococcus proximus]MDF0480355.1 P1 family peptidase [Vagococcus proximus]
MEKKRFREEGFKLDGVPGMYNAITDVTGVEVGYSTVWLGEPADYKGDFSNFARTGVTTILPRGKKRSAVYAGRFDLNGNGEMTGSHWIDDSGFLHGPIGITNTHSVGIVRDSLAKWMVQNKFYYPLIMNGKPVENCSFFYPVVGETWDGMLNDTNGFHVEEKHVMEALKNAKSGTPAEGNVGGGTGMKCHGFKGGSGTSSRVLPKEEGGYTVGAFVQANHGPRDKFKVYGLPIGKLIEGHQAVLNTDAPKPGSGSIIVVLATDAPLSPTQLTKLCKRVPIGLGELGAGCENGSGDIFLAFSTANEKAYTTSTSTADVLGDDLIDPLYNAVVQSVEEAILNALFAADDLVGRNGNTYYAIPHDEVKSIVREYRPDCLVESE